MSTAADVVSRLGADISAGLTPDEVERRRRAFGRNEFTIKEEEPLWRKYLNQVICLSHGGKNNVVHRSIPRPFLEYLYTFLPHTNNLKLCWPKIHSPASVFHIAVQVYLPQCVYLTPSLSCSSPLPSPVQRPSHSTPAGLSYHQSRCQATRRCFLHHCGILISMQPRPLHIPKQRQVVHDSPCTLYTD